MSEEKDNLTEEQNENPKKGTKSKKPKFNIYWIYGLIALSFIGIQFLDIGVSMQKIDEFEFDEMLNKGHIKELIVITNKQKANIYLNKSSLKTYKKRLGDDYSEEGPQFYYKFPNTVNNFVDSAKKVRMKLADDKQFVIDSDEEKDVVGDILGWVIPIAIIVVVWLFIFRRMGGGGGGGGGNIFSIGKSRAKVFDKEEAEIKVNFNDVAGLMEAKVEITEIVDFLKKPQKYTELGGKIPKGALLVGPPGTGKTLLAKAVAGEANVPFFSMSGSDFVEMFVGVGASRVRDLFQQAKQKAPCIIFIDEIDAIGRARGRNPNVGSNDERENTLNQLLTEMDGFDTNTGVIILAATNRQDVLDPALLRAGRFDRQIHVELPDITERKAIFEVHLKPIKVDQNFDISFLAKQTPGFSGADIANVCNEAALIAARNEKKAVEKEDFLEAVDRIIGGLEKKNKIITLHEKKAIAFHEGGHAAVSWLLEHAHPLIKVTIVPRGSALGAAWYLPDERHLTTTEQILDEMCSLMGGRASEEVFFGKVSTGALNDLEKATKQAYAMVVFYGMSSEIGNLSYYDSSGQNEYSFTKPYSEKTSEVIDKEIAKILKEQYNRAKEIITNNKDGMVQLSERLLEKEVLFSEDLEEIFGKRKFNDGEIFKEKVANDVSEKSEEKDS